MNEDEEPLKTVIRDATETNLKARSKLKIADATSACVWHVHVNMS